MEGAEFGSQGLTARATSVTLPLMKPKDSQVAREIGARIVQARREMGGMTQRELGELIGVSERSIQAYEQGETIPYLRGRDLERVFGRPMSWFWNGEESVSAEDAAEMRRELAQLRHQLDNVVEQVERLWAALPAS